MSTDDDNFPALLAAARSADPAARNELFKRVYPVVGPLVHQRLSRDVRRGRPWLDARFSTGDVVQDVCQSVLADLSAFAGETQADFEAYLALVVRNRIIDAIRFHEAQRRDGRRAHRDLDFIDGVSREAAPDDAAEGQEFQDSFASAIAELSERDQILVRARLDGSQSFEELARILGYSSVSKAQRTFAELRARIAVRMSQHMRDESR